MDEIVPADRDQPSTSRTRPRAPDYRDAPPEPFDSEKLPQTLVSEVRPFLRVANQIEAESPRVAYLCRFHAFERAHVMDPRSTGRGVRQFKTSLLQRLEQDDEATTGRRTEKSDARELKSFYHKKRFMQSHEIAYVLSEVWKAVVSGAGPEILAAGEHIKERSGSYCPYNILPLDPGGSQQAIMLLPEIKAAVSAVRNIRGLPSENNQDTHAFIDLLEWLKCWFGFQKGNVANQREHLILLLANLHVRQNPKTASVSKLDDRAVDELMMKIFGNYMSWCKFLGRKSNLLLPHVKQEVQQYKILYIALYLLIWGEASNLRLMPECLCYIFHHMAYELNGVLSGAISLNTGEKVVPAYGGGSESFLEHVVTPLYQVIYEEARKNKHGTADHSRWRNYDDLNEFFWSLDCFKLGWPMRLDNDFFCTLSPTVQNSNSQATTSENFQNKWLGKTNFVEIRSFWHIFRSFDRMWTFFVLSLQAMIIMAWHGLETPLQVLDPLIFDDILTIFITNAVLRLIQVILDITFTWKARHTLNFYQKLRFLLKFFIAAIWTITLPSSYAASQTNSARSTSRLADSESNLNDFCLSPYMIIVVIYLTTNFIGVILFLVPAVSGFIETSNRPTCNIFSWWAQPRLFIGRGMQEPILSLLKYTVFWVILLSSKFLFSYHFEIKPLVEPTKQIMKVSMDNYDWHVLFPEVKSNAGAILALWAPIVLVFFMDTQIWYSIFCTIFGGAYGIIHHLGEIRTMGMVRSRFHSLPCVFKDSLVPQSSKKEKKNIRSFLYNKIFKSSEIGVNDLAKFALVWNQIITSFHTEDLISCREMDLMIMPLSSEFGCGRAQWPLFLLATKFSTAINMARDFMGKYHHLRRKLKKDHCMFYAVQECYDSLKVIFGVLIAGELERSFQGCRCHI